MVGIAKDAEAKGAKVARREQEIMAHKSGKKSYPAKRGHPGKAPKLGSGARFKALVGKLAGKVKNPAALAAFIGRKKYGAKKFAKLSAAGRKRGKNLWASE